MHEPADTVTRGGAPSFRPVAYLEQCGSAGRRVLTTYANVSGTIPIASDSREIVWGTAQGQLTGIYLPSLKRFTVNAGGLIRRAAGQTGILDLALTPRNLYVGFGDVSALVLRRP